MTQIQFLDEARSELLEAVEFYEARAVGLGGKLVDEVEGCLERLSENPELGASYIDDTRKIVVDRFPFNIVYLLENETILIVALAHHRRKPGYWADR